MVQHQQHQALARRGVNAADLSSRVQDYFSELEEERGALRSEVDLLTTQHQDLGRALAIAESRAERAEREREQARAQRDDALQKLVALTTLFGSIKNTVDQGEGLIAQTAGALKTAAGRNGRIADVTESVIAEALGETQPAASNAA